jgi:cytochrome c oxidase subunit IV
MQRIIQFFDHTSRAASDRWRRQALLAANIVAWLVIVILVAMIVVAAEALLSRGQNLIAIDLIDLAPENT